jgi:hypothetical protein
VNTYSQTIIGSVSGNAATATLATVATGATNDNLARKISTTYAPLAGTNDWTGTNDFKNQVKVDATKGIIIGTSVLTNVPGTLYLSGNLNMAGGDLAADSFVGNGGDLTALDASQLTDGTVPTNRLAALIGANTTGNAGTATLATLAIGATNDDLGRKISTTYITAAAANYTNAQFTPYQLLSGSVTIYPTNGNLQRYVITNASTITIAGATTNYVESLRLSIHGSNTITWAGTLSNASVGTCTVAVTELLLDHSENTNLWWMYRLR